MYQALVSIVVPVYKVENYLDKCVNSIVTQSYKNLEIILVDDGSPDKSSLMCDKWAKKDSRIKVIHKENGGLSDARNCGIRKAKGEYLFFVDSDDWIAPDIIKKMVFYMHKFHADMVVCQFVYAFSNGKIKRNYNSRKRVKCLSKKQAFDLLAKDYEITNHVWRKLYKRTLVPEEIFPKGKNFEDSFAMPTLFSKCEVIVSINDIGYYYRQNENSISHTESMANVQDHYESILKSYNDILKYMPSSKWLAFRTKINREIGMYEFLLVHQFKNNDRKQAEELKKKVHKDISNFSYIFIIHGFKHKVFLCVDKFFNYLDCWYLKKYVKF